MTNLLDLFTAADYKAASDARLLTVRDNGAADLDEKLWILNYSDAALYTPGAWDNPAVRACRGLIVNAENDIVARPWAKFFNHNQPEAGDLDLSEPVEVTDKLDGSLGIVYRELGGGLAVATRGSFTSDQAVHATRLLRVKYAGVDADMVEAVTPLVEIIYPDNRIVVDYDGLDDLVLLGGVEVATGRYLGPQTTALVVDWKGPVARVFGYSTLGDALAAAPRPNSEGLCVRFRDSRIVKVKQDDYVRLHRIVTGLSERTVWQHLMEVKPVSELLDGLPDELHAWVIDVATTLSGAVKDRVRAVRATHDDILADLPAGWTRREYAERAGQHPDLRPFLFMHLDGRDTRIPILKTLKPAGDTRAKNLSETTA